MKTYTQTLTFRRRVNIEAKNAADANVKLKELISDVEWGADVDYVRGFYNFEDPEVEEETEDKDE